MNEAITDGLLRALMTNLRMMTANIGLAALVVLDVPLTIAAIHHGRGPDVSPTVAASSALSSSPTPASSGAAAPSSGFRRSALLLSFSSKTAGWRARLGCHRSSHLAATTDGGRHWSRITSPARHVLRLNQSSATSGWLIGANASCVPAFFSTSDGGRTWLTATGLGQAWVVLGRRLRIPSGQLVDPCRKPERLVGVTVADVRTALADCGSGLRVTSDGGTTWRRAGRFDGTGQLAAVALEPAGGGRGVALLTGAAGCAGLAVERTNDAGKRWHGGPCISGLGTPAAVALAPDGSGYAASGAKSAVTVDGGTTWASG
ncbi:MAG TPA: hypothetical protein VHD81_12810 [Mycobacteriales bacterium]|nr:hypothetical protein [Mycobacteriales bacterium]